MNFIIVPISPEDSKPGFYRQLAQLALELGIQPNAEVRGTEDEPYDLIGKMVSGIAHGTLIVSRSPARTEDEDGVENDFQSD